MTKVFCLFGSVTGKAQSIAEQIFEQAVARGYETELHSFDKFGRDWSLDQVRLAVIVSSTTGDGEQPETLIKFWRKLRPKSLPPDHLAQLNYAILGLGDTNYNQFCNGPKNLHRRLQELGAKAYHSPGWADDGTGLEVVVDPWIEGLWSSLATQYTQLGGLLNPQQEVNGDCGQKKAGNLTAVDQKLTEVVAGGDQKMAEKVTESDKMAENGTDIEKRTENGPEKMLENLQIDEKRSEVGSLTFSPHLSQISKLDVPAFPHPFLHVEFNDNMAENENGGNAITTTATAITKAQPLADGPVRRVKVVSNRRLSAQDAVKTYMELTMDMGEEEEHWFDYLPGDTVGIICQNIDSEVEALAARIGIADKLDKICTVSILKDTKKPKAKIPDHITPGSTVRDILTKDLDIRCVPKKLFIRALAEYTSEEREQRRLLELCCKQGGDEYGQFVREAGLGLIDLLSAFPSCQPSLSLLMEQCTKLLPRPYSISSTPLQCRNLLSVVYTVVEEPRPGIATSRLVKLRENDSLEMYPRGMKNFRPPNLATNLIMICAGSGLGPFIGFLNHRRELCKDEAVKKGNVWLFFGCRHKMKDFLYRDELNALETDRVLDKLSVSFSRDEDNGGVRYVQDRLLASKDEVADWILTKNASVYVCGDAKNMGKSVTTALEQILDGADGVEDGKQCLNQMSKEKRYLQDVWT